MLGLAKKATFLQVILTLFLFGLGTASASMPKPQATTLADQVRHQILMLPYYSVFDNITFKMEGQDTIVLQGQVTWPIVKFDAEAAVRSINGVGKIINDIQVLPVSRFDNHIRWATYWAIYSRPGFEKYAIQAIAPIRIIVESGHVTLDGYVGSELDKKLAYMAANAVPGVFSVTDNLKIG
jgi:hyperosmotically inducible protein